MRTADRKKDKWGCFYDLKIEALEEARYEVHLVEHESYPQSWCEWCEEEAGKKHKEDKVGGIVDTIRKLRRRKNAKIL